MTTGTDPSTVPDWPAPVVRLTGQGTVEVDGAVLPLPPGLDGADARQWAVKNVAERYARLGRAIRVTAVEADGTSFPLIVHPDGTVEALAVEAAGGRRGKRRPRPASATAKSDTPRGGKSAPGAKGANDRSQEGKSQAKGLIAMGVFLGVIVLGGVVVFSGGGGDPDTAPHSVATTPSAKPTPPPPANLPRPAPDGWTTRAAWALKISGQIGPAVDEDGTIAAVTDKGQLVVLDGASGVTKWSAGVPNDASGSLVFTRIDGQRVVAVSTGQALHYWGIDGDEHPHHSVNIPNSGTVTFLGPSPLISLRDATAAVIADGKVQNVDLPVRTTALAADQQTVLAADPSGHWWRLAPGKQPDKGLEMKSPADKAQLNTVLGVDGGRLVGVWKKDDTTWATAYDAATGKPLATGKAAKDPGTLTVRAAGPLVAVGPLLLDTQRGSSREVTGATPRSAAAGRIYAVDPQQRWHTLTTGADVVMNSKDVAIPLGVSAKRALVVADKLGEKLLYALSPSTNGEQQPAPDGSGQVAAPEPPGQGTS
ncbi:PQQ-binding-like beta-propeller repeat protein [Streptomyces sp. C36]|uniref:outer membrane protein assembly factor BamB family protein n=1 Tax=Streptomyces sp. C36 TaxID=3237122 RepID=UPI0034C5CD84